MKKILFFITCLVISALLFMNCLNGFMNCPKTKNIKKNIFYLKPDANQKYSDSLIISIEKIKPDKYLINYNLLFFLLNKGTTEYDLCALTINKEIHGDIMNINISPSTRSVGKVGSDVMGMYKQILLIQTSKEKLPSDVKKIQFSYIRKTEIFDTVNKRIKPQLINKEKIITLPEKKLEISIPNKN